MDLQGRGLHRAHTLRLVDTTGQEHTLVTGNITDVEGRLVPVFAVDDGPSLILEPVYEGGESSKLGLLAMHTLLDHQDLLTKQEIERRRSR